MLNNGIILELITSFMESVLLIFLLSVLYAKNFILENKMKSFCFCVLYTAVSCLNTLIVPSFFHTLLIAFFTIFLINVFVQKSFYSSIIVVAIMTILVAITELPIMLIATALTGLHVDALVSIVKYRLFIIISAKSLQFCIVFLLSKINLNKFNIFKEEGSNYSYILLQFSLFGFTIASTSSIANADNPHIYYVLIVAIYLLNLFLGLLDIKERKRLIAIVNKYKIQEQHIKNMEDIINIIRKEKHDYANHINLIQAIGTLNKPDALVDINNYVKAISNSIHNSCQFYDTGNAYIDGLLAIKNSFAKKENILFDVKISEQFTSIKIPADELIGIVSNLLDNAIEALEATDNIEKQITINTFIENEVFVLQISNNGKEISGNIMQHIFDIGFSTKSKKADHGFGLFIVKELIIKNYGIISVDSNSQETKFTITFPVNRGKIGQNS